MLNALIVFFLGALILCLIIYVFKLVIGMLALPPEVKNIALLIISVIGLFFLILITIDAYRAAGGGVVIFR